MFWVSLQTSTACCAEASDLSYFLFGLSSQVLAEKMLVPEPEGTHSAVRFQFLAVLNVSLQASLGTLGRRI